MAIPAKEMSPANAMTQAVSPSGQDVLESGLYPLYVRPVHGTPLIVLPFDIATEIWREVGATMDMDLDTMNPVIPCSMRNSSGSLDFRLAGPDGPVVRVPMSELVLPLYLANRTPFEQQWLWLNSVFYDDGLRAESCLFAVGKLYDVAAAAKSPGLPSPYPAPFCLGDPFLRAAYMVFDVANKEFGVAQSNPHPTASSVLWFDGASAKIPLATPGPPFREPASVTQVSVTPRATLAAAAGFRILRDLDTTEASPGSDQASTTAGPSSDAEKASSSYARRLALGLGVGIPLGLLALALAFIVFWVRVLRRSLQCCGPCFWAKQGDNNTRAELETKNASREAAEVSGASRVHELSANTGFTQRMHSSATSDASRSKASGPDAAPEAVSPATCQSFGPLGPPSVSP